MISGASMSKNSNLLPKFTLSKDSLALAKSPILPEAERLATVVTLAFVRAVSLVSSQKAPDPDLGPIDLVTHDSSVISRAAAFETLKAADAFAEQALNTLPPEKLYLCVPKALAKPSIITGLLDIGNDVQNLVKIAQLEKPRSPAVG